MKTEASYNGLGKSFKVSFGLLDLPAATKMEILFDLLRDSGLEGVILSAPTETQNAFAVAIEAYRSK